jgi:sugar/nucleoside kinase (ribokinase family)
MRKYDVLAIGDINLDIITNPMENFTLDEGEFLVENMKLNPGGNAANFVLAAANLGLKNRFIGCLGFDPLGKMLFDTLKEKKIDCHIKTFTNIGTGITFVLTHKDSKRQLIGFGGANIELSQECIDLKMVKEVDYLFRGGYWYAPKLIGKPTKDIFNFARKHDVKTSIDIGPERRWADFHRESIYPLLEDTSILFSNVSELLALTKTENIEEGARLLLDRGVEIVAVHMGKEGAVAFSHEEKVLVKPNEIIPRNPTGAGDIFNAAFIFGLSKNWSLRKTTKFANAFGAFHTENVENPYPTIKDVIKRFNLEI